MLSSRVTIARPIPFDQNDALRFLPEGPQSLSTDQVSWVGIQHGGDSKVGSVNVLDLQSGRNQSHELPGRPGFALAGSDPGTFVVGLERSIGLFNTADQSWQPWCEGVDNDVDNTIINDGLQVGDNLIFGTKDLEFATKKAGLYLYRASDKSLIRLRDDQICSNGKAVIGGDDQTVEFLDIDSPTRTIVRYQLDVAAGELSGGDVVVDFEGDAAVPDGQIVTNDRRSLIVSMFRPEVAEHGETRMYEIATGRLQHVWITPRSPQNTCPALIDTSEGQRLLITTAVENMSDEDVKQCPDAGRLFIATLPWS